VSPDDVLVRPRGADDDDWVVATMTEEWGSTDVARLGELVDTTDLPGYVAELAGRPVGLALTARRDDEYEVVSLSVSATRRGIGGQLLQRCVDEAVVLGCRRIWLITTNDNTGALAFYQRLGLDICRLHRHGVTRARALKPSIPEQDAHGVRIDHEIELELLLRDP
jgi:ribosomal protein S18 acetylase RimI-like enzyme